MYQPPKHQADANFKAAVLDAQTGRFWNIFTFPNHKGKQLEKLKEHLTKLKNPTELAIIYDLKRPNSDGWPTEIGRYQNGKFNFN